MNNPTPGSKASAIFAGLSNLSAGKSLFFWSTDGKIEAYWSLSHELFSTDEYGEPEHIIHLPFWQRPTKKELIDIVRSYEVAHETAFTFTQKKPDSRMLRLQRIV